MACNIVTFHGVTPEVFNCLKSKLAAEGVYGPNADKGELSGFGVRVKYGFSAPTLTIEVEGKPFFFTCGFITGKLHDALSACGDQNQ